MIEFEQERRSCPVCGSTDARLFVEAHFSESDLDSMSFSSRKVPEGLYHRLLECASCDLLYASPVPTFKSLSDAYRDAGYESGEEARYAAATYAEVFASIALSLPDLRAAADIGAGDGAFLERLREAGFDEIVGFEPSTAPLAAAPADLRPSIRPEPFGTGILPDESFTLVSCMQTIEHVLEPLEVCRDAVRALAPRGAVLIACHDRRALRRVSSSSARRSSTSSMSSCSPSRASERCSVSQVSSGSRCVRCEIAIPSGTGSSWRRCQRACARRCGEYWR